MKRILLTIFILAILAGTLSPLFGAVTNTLTNVRPTSYWWTGEPRADRALLQARELEVLLGATAGTATASKALILSSSAGTSALLFTPTDTAPAATEGQLYYHESDEALKLRTSDAWVDIDVSGASSLGTAYGIGSAITVDTSAITLTSTDAANNVILALVHGETGNFSAMTVTNASAYPGIQITGSSTGADIAGTSATWSVATTGVATLVGGIIGDSDLTFSEPTSNDVYLLADADSQLTIGGTSKDDINLNFHTADTLTISSSTGMDKVVWGGVDEHSGLLSLTFDPAVAGLITIAGTGDTDDISITNTGTTDVSVALVSAGSVTDAIHIESSDSVGGILLDSGDIFDIDAVDDITIDTTDGTYTLTIAGSSDGDYIMTAADTSSSISVDDFHIGSTAGSITIEAEEDAANAVLITADGSTASTLKLHNDTGSSVTEGAASIELLSDVGGIELRSTANLANAIALTVENSTTSSILVYNDSGTSVTENGYSIEILSDDGGVEIKSKANLAKAVNIMVDQNTVSSIMIFNDTGTSVTENAASIEIWSDAGGIELQSDANLDDALVLRVDGGTTSEMSLHNDQGTAADSIELVSDVGGITLTAGDATTADILIDANDVLHLLSASIADNGLTIEADGGVLEGIYIHADQGTSDDSIELLSDVGGINITAEDTTGGDILIDANDILTLLSASIAADGIYLHTDGGAAEGILLRSDQGTSADSVELLSDVGGITITTAGTTAGDILVDANDAVTIVGAGLAANTVYIYEAGGTSSTIKINAQTGTGDESIFLDSDAGGITLNANAGSIDIEAVGGTDGDIGINAGDDLTITAAGDLTLAVTGTLAGGGATMDNFYSTTEVVAGTSDTLTAAQSGNMIIYTQTGGACTVTLPEATSGTVGMWFFIIDGNPAAAADLVIDPEGGGQINGDTAGNSITCVNDRDGEGILIFSTAADVWYTIAFGSSTVWTEE